MKKLFFLLCFSTVSLFLSAQSWPNLQRPDPFRLRAAPLQSRGNLQLRCDSIYRFYFASETDSVLQGRTRFNYFGDTLRVGVTENSETITGFSPITNSRTFDYYDSQGRVIESALETWENNSFQPVIRYLFYYHGSTLEYDSAHVYSWQNGQVQLQNSVYYEYLPGTTLPSQYTFIWFPLSGGSRSRTYYTYDSHLFPVLFYTNTVLPDGTEVPGTRSVFNRQNDTLVITNDGFNSTFNYWQPNTRQIQVIDLTSRKVLHEVYYNFSADTNDWLAFGEVTATYNPAGLFTSVQTFNYTDSTQQLNTYSYKLGVNPLQSSDYWRNPGDPSWQIRAKEYFFYPDVSGTVTPTATVTVKAAPNPATDAVWLDAGTQAIQAVRVFDSNERLVRTLTGGNQPTVALERSGLPAGVYQVQVQTAQGSTVLPLIFN